jgi:hypothetical protein
VEYPSSIDRRCERAFPIGHTDAEAMKPEARLVEPIVMGGVVGVQTRPDGKLDRPIANEIT